MEKRTIRIDTNQYTSYRDNLARKPQPKVEPAPAPEIQPAPRRGVRIHSKPQEKSHVKPMWMAAVAMVAVLYMVLVSQYMTLTEISLQVSDYKSTILDCDEEISKMKKFTLSQISEEELDSFVRRYDMDKVSRSDVEYINYGAEESIVSYNGRNTKGEENARNAFTQIKNSLMRAVEFVR
ncbi:MAG: hypothetical protein IKZ21_00360 [Clostridia bacterium]|nr:hypothetical protein [Clostridia bacterium]